MGGLTFSHNKGGMYTRKRVIPVNPRTALQTAVRNGFKTTSSLWASALTSSQRAGWTAFAQANPVPNKLGAPCILTGLQMFMRFNTPIVTYFASVGIFLSAPSVGTFIPAPNPITAIVTGSTGKITALNVTLPYVPATGDYLLISISAPVSIGHTANGTNSRVGAPYTEGVTPANPTVIATMDDPFNVSGGVRASGSPYRLSVYYIDETNGNISSVGTINGVTV
jgi:hypothetical protein